jgi:hypothetical protein
MLLALAAASATALLNACSLGADAGASDRTEPTYSHSAAAEAIAALPGITAAEVATSTEGTPNQVLLLARVNATAGYAPDPTVLLDHVLRQAWATTETEPTTTVRVDLTVAGQDLDLVAVAEQLGLEGSIDSDNKYDASLRLPVDRVAAAYGPWPGAVPDTPTELRATAG